MSRQSNAKEKQGWRKESRRCSNCQSFNIDKETKQSEWGGEWIKEKNKRCLLGNFATSKMCYCDDHQWKT